MADAQDTETNINNDEVPVAETTAWDAQSTIRTKEEKNEINAKTGEISEGDGTSPNLHTGTRDDGETAASSSFDEGSAGLFSNEHDAPTETVDAGAADAASQDDHDNAQDAALNQTTASLDMDAASDASDETETTAGASVVTPPEAASTQEQTASASPDQTAPEPAAPQETSTTTDTADTTDTAASTLDVQNDDPSQDDQTTQDTAASPTSTAEETNDPALNAGDDTLSEASPAETVDAGAADAASQDDHDNAQDAPLQETLVPDSLDSAPPTLLLDPDRPEMPLDAPVPGDTVALVVTLAGEAYKGNPDYEIVVDGEVVSTGSVDWSRETTSEGRYQTGDEIDWRDVSIDLVMPEGGFGQVEVRFPNDAYQADIGDRNLLVDKISLNGFEMEAEADETAYQGGNYADGASAERMPWSGTLEFDTSSVFENAEPLEAPEGAYILEGDAGAVIGTLSLDETSLENGSEVTVSDDRFEVIDGKLKLRDDIMLDFEAEPSLVLDVSITNAQGQVSSSQFEVAVANDPNYDTSVVTGTLETKFQAKYFDVSTSIKTLDDIGWDGASTFEESIDTIDYTKSSDSFWEGGSENTFGAQITGQIDVPEDGTFTFTLGADDGAVLYIDGVPIIDNDGLHAFKEESVDIQLEPGAHAIEVRYFENYGQAGLKLEWDGPGVDGPTLLTPAPADSLNGIEGVPLVFEVDLNLTESLETVQLDGLPAGTIISAGDQITTVGEDPVDLDNWDLSQISVTPPIGFTGSISAEITAEDVHGKRAAVDLEVDVQEAPIDLASAGVKAGFHVEFFEEDHKLTRMSDVDFDAEPAAEGIYSTLEFEKSSGSFHEDVAKDRFAVRATGDFEVEEGGVYDFQVGADDGAVLFINGVEVVENDGLHGFRDREGSVELEPGTHEIELRYFENTGKAGLNLQFKGPDTDGAYEPVEASSELAANADGQLSFAVDLGGLNDVSSVSLSGLPTGTWISAGDQNALVTDETTDITDWDLDALAIDVPEGFSADVEVQLDATGTLFNGAQKTLSQSFTIENQGTEEGSGIENEIEWPDEGPSAWDQNTSDTQEHEFDLSETNIDIEEQQTEVEYAHSSIDF
ncbi:MAG: PA14 domain-containing protein [Litoreibacter sp.]